MPVVTAAIVAGSLLVPGGATDRAGRAQGGEPVARPAVTAGGLVFVSAVDGRAGASNQDAGIAAETRRALERLRAVLETAGSSLGQVAAVNVYLRNASDFAAMNEAYRPFFPEAPPTRTTVVSDLTGSDLIAMSAVAVPNGGGRDVLHPAGWPRSPRPYSYVIRTEHLVFLSGLVSRRGVDDQLVPGPIGTQMTTIFDNARTLLATAGLGFPDVVAARVFMTDELYFMDMNDAYRRVFMTNPPARATAITPLMAGDAKVEITLIASASGREVFGPTVAPAVPLSAAVTAGPFVFLSGVLGNTSANRADAAAQTREALTRIGRTLETAGTSFAQVVDNLVLIRDLGQQGDVDRVYREFFPSAPPARATVGARLVSSTGLVEVMTTAARRD